MTQPAPGALQPTRQVQDRCTGQAQKARGHSRTGAGQQEPSSQVSKASVSFFPFSGLLSSSSALQAKETPSFLPPQEPGGHWV